MSTGVGDYGWEGLCTLHHMGEGVHISLEWLGWKTKASLARIQGRSRVQNRLHIHLAVLLGSNLEWISRES